jgi:hypothetical protein
LFFTKVGECWEFAWGMEPGERGRWEKDWEDEKKDGETGRRGDDQDERDDGKDGEDQAKKD